MTQPVPMALTTTPATAATPATTTVGPPPVKRGGWAESFVARVSPAPAAPIAPVPTAAPTISYGQAAGRAVGDGVTVSIASALFGAAHGRGMLDAGRAAIDGLIGLLGLGLSIAAAPHAPKLARIASNVGLSGLASISFRKGFELSAGRPMSAPTPPTPGKGGDSIADAAKDLGV